MPDDNPALNVDPNRPWYSIQAATDKPRRAKVMIYDAIGGWFGIRTSDFVRELNALDVDEIDLHLNSPGGAAWDGIAIHNALRQHKARVTVTVDGLAASAASAVAMGGDEVVMARGSQMMIHDASGGAWGPAAFMRKTADILDKLSGNYAKLYAAKAGGKPEVWRELMLAETWYDADEATAAGLADRTDDNTEADAEAMAAFDLSIFNYAGRDKAPAPLPQSIFAGLYATHPSEFVGGEAARVRAEWAAGAFSLPITPQAPVSSEPGHHNRKEGTLMEEFLADLRKRLGLDAEATVEAILAAFDDKIAGSATASTTPPGTVLIEQGVLDSLTADAAAGRQAREEQIKARRDGMIATALSEGRITKVSAAAFREQLDANEAGTAAILATLAPNTRVPVTELGHAASAEDTEDDALYSALYPTRKES